MWRRRVIPPSRKLFSTDVFLKDYRPPDLVAALNAGFILYDSWVQSLPEVGGQILGSKGRRGVVGGGEMITVSVLMKFYF